jgi:hypothetical protein
MALRKDTKQGERDLSLKCKTDEEGEKRRGE